MLRGKPCHGRRFPSSSFNTRPHIWYWSSKNQSPYWSWRMTQNWPPSKTWHAEASQTSLHHIQDKKEKGGWSLSYFTTSISTGMACLENMPDYIHCYKGGLWQNIKIKQNLFLSFQLTTNTWASATSSNIGTEREGMGGQQELEIKCDALGRSSCIK